MYSFVQDPYRRKLLAMTTQLDDSIGTLVATLRNRDMLNDTVIAFTSDNGAPSYWYGSNYPLRGSKATVYEGGTRVRAFINVPGRPACETNGMFHAVDWLPTLIGAALDRNTSM